MQANRGRHPIVCVLFAHNSREALEQKMTMLDSNAAGRAGGAGVICDLIQGSPAVIECEIAAATITFKPASSAPELP
jgi:hypothetical protein